MFVVTNSMFGLMILSLGILGIIISFLLTQRTRYFIALGLSTLLVVIGLFSRWAPACINGVRRVKSPKFRNKTG